MCCDREVEPWSPARSVETDLRAGFVEEIARSHLRRPTRPEGGCHPRTLHCGYFYLRPTDAL